MAIATMPGDGKGKEGIVEIWNDLEGATTTAWV